MVFLPPDKVKAKLAKLEQQQMSRRTLPSDIQEKVDAENRRRTLLKYLLAVLLGIFALVVASIIDAQSDMSSADLTATAIAVPATSQNHIIQDCDGIPLEYIRGQFAPDVDVLCRGVSFFAGNGIEVPEMANMELLKASFYDRGRDWFLTLQFALDYVSDADVLLSLLTMRVLYENTICDLGDAAHLIYDVDLRVDSGTFLIDLTTGQITCEHDVVLYDHSAFSGLLLSQTPQTREAEWQKESDAFVFCVANDLDGSAKRLDNCIESFRMLPPLLDAEVDIEKIVAVVGHRNMNFPIVEAYFHAAQ